MADRTEVLLERILAELTLANSLTVAQIATHQGVPKQELIDTANASRRKLFEAIHGDEEVEA